MLSVYTSGEVTEPCHTIMTSLQAEAFRGLSRAEVSRSYSLEG